jgi:2-iminobutanoate/2-iminopropanoate deaminase
MPEKVVIVSDKAPQPIGPYSAGIRFGHFVFTCTGRDRPFTGKLVEGGVEAEARQVMKNLAHILKW